MTSTSHGSETRTEQLEGISRINEPSSAVYPQVEDDDDLPTQALLDSDAAMDNNGNQSIHQSSHKPASVGTSYLVLLNLGIFGVQMAWTVHFSYGSPYLLSLGIPKSILALVWIAAPLSGTLVQPYVGIKSDQCRSRFGKRRPFMVGGAVLTAVFLMALAWVKEIFGSFLIFTGTTPSEGFVTKGPAIIAVFLVYGLDFSVNFVQAATRAFIVDQAPAHQQDSANAWASRISGIGNIIGYLFGYNDLDKYLPILGNTQFKILCAIASISMLATVIISCLTIHEKDARLDERQNKDSMDVFGLFKNLLRAIRTLPDQIAIVCKVQFFAWVGWFPFLFYITTYVGGIYVNPIFKENPQMTDAEVEEAWQRGTQVATFAMFIFAIVTLSASFLIPALIASVFDRHDNVVSKDEPGTNPGDKASFRSFTRQCSRLLVIPKIPHLTTRRAWLFSHIVFFILTWATLFVRTTISATILVALIGIPWAITNWAPYALIAAEIRRRELHYAGVLHREHGETHQLEIDDSPSNRTGVLLGIHNIAIAAPQIIATVASSVLFRALQKPRGAVGDDSVAWILRIGGVSALVAAWLAKRVNEVTSRQA